VAAKKQMGAGAISRRVVATCCEIGLLFLSLKGAISCRSLAVLLGRALGENNTAFWRFFSPLFYPDFGSNFGSKAARRSELKEAKRARDPKLLLLGSLVAKRRRSRERGEMPIKWIKWANWKIGKYSFPNDWSLQEASSNRKRRAASV